MIRFILKNEQDEYATATIHSDLLERLMYHRLPTFKIVGQEHIENAINTLPVEVLPNGKIGIRVNTKSEPKFPEKYTPVIVRDGDDEIWTPELFLHKDDNHRDLWFDCVGTSFKQIAPLTGNEHLIDTIGRPPFYWKVKDKTAELIKP